jgi:hypothetical protein
MINTHKDRMLPFSTPPPDGSDNDWQLIIDTAAASPDDFPVSPAPPARQKNSSIIVRPFGCIVLQSCLQAQ